jgi:hypothetical protein
LCCFVFVEALVAEKAQLSSPALSECLPLVLRALAAAERSHPLNPTRALSAHSTLTLTATGFDPLLRFCRHLANILDRTVQSLAALDQEQSAVKPSGLTTALEAQQTVKASPSSSAHHDLEQKLRTLLRFFTSEFSTSADADVIVQCGVLPVLCGFALHRRLSVHGSPHSPLSRIAWRVFLHLIIACLSRDLSSENSAAMSSIGALLLSALKSKLDVLRTSTPALQPLAMSVAPPPQVSTSVKFPHDLKPGDFCDGLDR